MIGSFKKPRSSDAKIEAPADTDDFVPDYTRTSDTKKKYAQHRSSQSSFGSQKPVAEAGVITRTSDRKSLYKKAPEGPREKPAHSSKPYAVWLLSRRDYSAGILRNKLVLRGYDADEANVAMSFVIANGYQNDERYAESLARTLSRRAGNSRLLMTMSQKKIDPATAVLKLGTLVPESERVIDVAAKFRKDVAAGGMTQKLQQKIYRFLAYRGFSGESIKIAMQSLAAGQQDEDSAELF
jgi:regulatory protein